MNFKNTKEYVKGTSTLDGFKFNTVKDLTNMIDLLNKETEKANQVDADKELHSISEFVVRSLTEKTFILGKGR